VQAIVIRNLARVFLNAAHLNASGSAFAELLTKLGPAFIPRPVSELTALGVVQRLGAVSADAEWTVVLSTESADVQYNPRVGAAGISIAEFCTRASPILRQLHDLVGQPASRIAVVREGLGERTPSTALDELRQRLLQVTVPWEGHCSEWDWRVCSHVVRSFGSQSEPTNTIGILKRIEVAFPGADPEDRLFFSTDVNTLPGSRRPRFSAEDSEAFVRAAASWHDDLETSLKRLIQAGHK
jgi:hypothetical protein